MCSSYLAASSLRPFPDTVDVALALICDLNSEKQMKYRPTNDVWYWRNENSLGERSTPSHDGYDRERLIITVKVNIITRKINIIMVWSTRLILSMGLAWEWYGRMIVRMMPCSLANAHKVLVINFVPLFISKNFDVLHREITSSSNAYRFAFRGSYHTTLPLRK